MTTRITDEICGWKEAWKENTDDSRVSIWVGHRVCREFSIKGIVRL